MVLSGKEVLKHNSKDSCYVIVNGLAYDVTEFMPVCLQSPSVTGDIGGSLMFMRLTAVGTSRWDGNVRKRLYEAAVSIG